MPSERLPLPSAYEFVSLAVLPIPPGMHAPAPPALLPVPPPTRAYSALARLLSPPPTLAYVGALAPVVVAFWSPPETVAYSPVIGGRLSVVSLPRFVSPTDPSSGN